ncbi:hypothetical protein [Priestia megaterium]|uniref:hypothetical protein n=1 Tax=Priestia megaterium TaxID=1404 RepID=UPI000BECEF6A|nr:hypothetical protein [Priestia megaterium]PED63977.1 hypothetical protein CON20_23710 [Priestia megaterium]
MAIARFLQTTHLIALNRTAQLNEEIDIQDQALIDHLVNKQLADILVEEEKPVTKSRKSKEATVTQDA